MPSPSIGVKNRCLLGFVDQQVSDRNSNFFHRTKIGACLGLLYVLSHPYFVRVGVKPNTWKSWELESSRTPECSELDSKGKNTSHWGVLGVVGKVLKRRYRKYLRIGNSDICSPSYGQKKGRESNWQGQRYRQGLQLWFRPRRDPTLQSGVMAVLSSGSPVGTISGLHFGSPNKMCHLDAASATSCREYYKE